MTYEELRALRPELLRKLKPVPQSRAEEIRKLAQDCPADFLDFLCTVGAGEIGNEALMVYDGLVSPDEIYGDGANVTLGNTLLFADDFQGFGIGFDGNSAWEVVEVDPTSWTKRRLARDFRTFISEFVSQLP